MPSCLKFFRMTFFPKHLRRTIYWKLGLLGTIPAGIYMVKVNKRNIRTRCEICSELTIKRPEQRQWRRSGVFIVNVTYFTPCCNVSIVNFKQVNADWDIMKNNNFRNVSISFPLPFPPCDFTET